ncbi:hypothetical protein D0Z00_001541 [Geotrichum galactomycetum]|uniref:Uncharacterized protein n=1 Tax=Geotrichum galactomycetum TaxID=27317 RepID=A0ACB6V6K3_9ASCO|nr:hypothetical protein D0Z00_001541 [Geotrichum candidum]
MTLLASLDARATASHAALLDAISSTVNPITSKEPAIAESAQHRALDAARHVKFLRLNAVAEARFLADAARAAQRGVRHELAAVRARLGQSAAAAGPHAVVASDSLEAIALEFDTLLDAPSNPINGLVSVLPADTVKLTNGHKTNAAAQMETPVIAPVQTTAASFVASQAPSLAAAPATPARLAVTNDITTSPLTPLPSDFDDILRFTPVPTQSHGSTPDLSQPLDAAKSPEPEQEFFTPPPFAESPLLPEPSITALTNTITKSPATDNHDRFMASKTNGHVRLAADSQSVPDSSDTSANAAIVITKQIRADHPLTNKATGSNLSKAVDTSSPNQVAKPDIVTPDESENLQNNGPNALVSNLSGRESNNKADSHKNGRKRSVVEIELEDIEPMSVSDINGRTHTRAENNFAKPLPIDLHRADGAGNHDSGESISQRRSRRAKPNEDANKNSVSRAWQKLNELVGPHFASSFVKHRIERHDLPADVAFPIIEQAHSWEQLVQGLKDEVAKRVPGFDPNDKDEFDRMWEKRKGKKAISKAHEPEQTPKKVEITTFTEANKTKKNGNKRENMVKLSKEPSVELDVDQTPVHVPGKRGRPKRSTAENRNHKKQKQELESGKSDEPGLVEVPVKDTEPNLKSKVKAKSSPAKSKSKRTKVQPDVRAVEEEETTEAESDTENLGSTATRPKTRASTKTQTKSTPTASSKSSTQSKFKEKAKPEPEADNEYYEPNDTLYCICQRPSFGQMVACDWETCPYEWYHLRCLKMRRLPPPDGKWYCPSCVELHGPPPTLEQEQEEERKRKEAEEQQKAAAARAKKNHKKAPRPTNKAKQPVEPLRRSIRKR